jgi:O-antigen/teichoic acid export membrane protein
MMSILTMRYLGPTNYGLINYVSAYITFFTSIIGLGINGVIIYELVNHKDENGSILGTTILFRLIVGVISMIAMLLVVYVADQGDRTTMIVAFLMSIQLPTLCLDTISYWYQAELKSKYSVMIQTIAYIAMSLYKVILMIAGKGVEWFAFATTLDLILLNGGYLFLYHKHRGQRLSCSKAAAKRLLSRCGPFILANVMSAIYGQMDRIMIKQMMGSNTEVGLYSAALTICQLVSFIPGAILESSRPLVVEAKATDETLYQLRFKQLSASILWVSGLYSLAITIFSKLVIYILYGADYMGANVCLKIAVWYTMFSYIGHAMNLWLICESKNRYVLWFCALGAIGNLLLNFALIPQFGINGAAVATLVTQLLTNFVFPACLRETRGYSKSVLEAALLRGIDLRSMVQYARQFITTKLKHKK